MATKTIKVPATITKGEEVYAPMTPVTLDAAEANSLLARWKDRGAEEVKAVPETAAIAGAPVTPAQSAVTQKK
jgi:hypothetical protein